jgi:hypothetical protein
MPSLYRFFMCAGSCHAAHIPSKFTPAAMSTAVP